MPPKKKSRPAGSQLNQIEPKQHLQHQQGQKSSFQDKNIQIERKIDNQSTLKAQPIKNEEIKQNKILITSSTGLSQEEILKLRRQKFKKSGQILFQEDQKIKQQRLKKFGAQPIQSKEKLQERKKKFNSSTDLLNEDEQLIRQRKLKFSQNSSLINQEDPSILQERKKKFAKNEQNLISLDEEIQKMKSKIFKKQQKRGFQKHRSRFVKKSNQQRQRNTFRNNHSNYNQGRLIKNKMIQKIRK